MHEAKENLASVTESVKENAAVILDYISDPMQIVSAIKADGAAMMMRGTATSEDIEKMASRALALLAIMQAQKKGL